MRADEKNSSLVSGFGKFAFKISADDKIVEAVLSLG